MTHRCEVIRVEDWRSPGWDADIPSRVGYDVVCNVCGSLPPHGWRYTAHVTACRVATQHERSAACQMSCDVDCEIGPVHCWNWHRPSHGAERRGWHDPQACDDAVAAAGLVT